MRFFSFYVLIYYTHSNSKRKKKKKKHDLKYIPTFRVFMNTVYNFRSRQCQGNESTLKLSQLNKLSTGGSSGGLKEGVKNPVIFERKL